jgi:3'(2'), 5'-bisphosphate nucleotidase
MTNDAKGESGGVLSARRPIDRMKTLDRALAIAREAGEGIARVYAGTFDVEYKGDRAKNDPVTVADKEANALICAELAKSYPGVPIVAEESDPASYAGFSRAPAVWFVDPLDGTREFIARNGEFAVMIGLAEAGRAVLGVLVLPAIGRSFVGAEGIGAFEVAADGARTSIHVGGRSTLQGARIVVSRSHRALDGEAKLAALGLVLEPCGSAGVKAARVACGEADLYAQPGNAGKLWDACAPEAIVRAAGGEWRNTLGDPYDYAREDITNRQGIVTGNGALVAALVSSFK